MLQDCESCGGQVSSDAASCPHCGHPVGSPTDRPRSERTVTTQATGKKAKAHQLIAALVAIVGVIMIVGPDQPSPFAPLLILAGLIWFLAARIYAWWQYG